MCPCEEAPSKPTPPKSSVTILSVGGLSAALLASVCCIGPLVFAAFAKVASVSSVEITVGEKWVFFLDYADVHAAVTFDPEKTGAAALVKAVETAGTALSSYKARVLKE